MNKVTTLHAAWINQLIAEWLHLSVLHPAPCSSLPEREGEKRKEKGGKRLPLPGPRCGGCDSRTLPYRLQL